MIHTNRIVTVGEQECIIDRPIVLYRGDREVEIEFTLVGNEFMFSEEGNVIKSVNASHGQLVLNTPSGEHMFSELAECHEGKVVFVVTKEMIDEFIEMGFYSFQIRLYDSAEMKSRVTIPPVMNGFDIRNPIAAEDETNVVDQGIVDYARIFKDQSNEELPTFTWDGEYVKTEWAHHDVITENKMNKIEDALYSINANIKESDVVMLNALDNVKKDADKYVKEHMAEVEADVDEFERNLNTDVQQFKIDTNAAMTAHKNEVSEELEGFSTQLAHIENGIVVSNSETLTDLRIVFQYNNKNDISKIMKLKELGLNTVILPKILDWQKNADEVKEFIELHRRYDLKVILELNTKTLIGDDYLSELSWVNTFKSYDNVIGFYSIDEPVGRKVPKSDQILTYKRLKTVTNKPIFISEVGFYDYRSELFEEYYTHECYDVYIVNNYLGHETEDWKIKRATDMVYKNFEKYGLEKPLYMIPNFAFFTTVDHVCETDYESLKYLIKAHAPYYKNSYCLFAFDNLAIPYSDEIPDGLITVIDNTQKYFDLAKMLNCLLKYEYFKEYEFEKPITVLTGDSSFDLITSNGIKTSSLSIGGGNNINKYMVKPCAVDVGVIESQTVFKKILEYDDVNRPDMVHCNPLGEFIDGVIYQANSIDGGIVLRLTNVRTTSVDLGQVQMYFDVFKR